MALEFITKETVGGFFTALAAGAGGWITFGRYYMSNRARNANDIQQIAMLERQAQSIERLESLNKQLRLEIAEKDDVIREYWKTITETQARLQIIESSQKHLEAQNEALKREVAVLTESNKKLASEINRFIASSGKTQ